ncbi:MAG: hypothetical protein AAF678_03185 [Pseudomonadota bacterium]
MKKKVILIGWHPDAVEFDKWPGLTPEKLMGAIRADSEVLRDAGFHIDVCLLTSAKSAVAEAESALSAASYDVVVIGAGVRRDEDHTLTFEALVNAVHKSAPQASFAFNTNPFDTADAVKRWA